MSVRAITWAFETEIRSRARTNPATAKLVLVALADRADEDGYCWPSVPTLARKCQLGDRTVQRVLHYLQEQGLLTIERQTIPRSGAQTSNRYRLALPSQISLPLQTPTGRHPGAKLTPGGSVPMTPAPRHADTGPVSPGTSPIRNNPSRDPSNEAEPTPPSALTARGRQDLSDEEFLAALKRNPAYANLDIDFELQKLDAWLLTPNGRGKHKTRGRIVRWLNRAASDRREVQVGAGGGSCVGSVRVDRFLKPCGKPVAPPDRNPKQLRLCVDCLAIREALDRRMGRA